MLFTSIERPLQTIVNTSNLKWENTAKQNPQAKSFMDAENLLNRIPLQVSFPKSVLKKTPKDWNPFENNLKNLLVDAVDQGKCGSCWAFSAVVCLTDRINILSGNKRFKKTLSPNLLLLCNVFSDYFANRQKITGDIEFSIDYQNTGCYGNNILSSIFYLYFFGTSTENCYPYIMRDLFEYKKRQNNITIQNTFSENKSDYRNEGEEIFDLSSFDQNIIPCAFYINSKRIPPLFCLNNVYENGSTYGTPFNAFYISYFYTISADQATTEIYRNGPIVTSFLVFDDFYRFDAKKENSVYIHDPKFKNIIGGHAVEVVGYGVTKENVPFWWTRNLWGKNYGVDGFFRFFRGNNQCEFESNFIGFLPNIAMEAPMITGNVINQQIMQKYYLKEQSDKEFLNIFNDILRFQFIQYAKTNESIIKQKIQNDYKKYGMLLFQLYQKVGLLHSQNTKNNFVFHSVLTMPNLPYFQNNESFVSLLDKNDSPTKKYKIPPYLIALIVFVLIFCCFYLFLLLKEKK